MLNRLLKTINSNSRVSKLVIACVALAAVCVCLVLIPKQAFASPDYNAIPLDVLGSPYSGQPYTSYNLPPSYDPPDSSSPGYYGNGYGSPSLTDYDSPAPPTGGGNNCYNGGILLLDNSWVSEPGPNSQIDGDLATGQEITETVGEKTIPLQFNEMQYLCYEDVINGVRGPADATPVSTSVILPNGSSLPSVTEYQVDGITAISTATGGGPAGTFSGLDGQISYICYQPATRYWFVGGSTCPPGDNSASGAFSFTPYDDVTQTVTLTIDVNGISFFPAAAGEPSHGYTCAETDTTPVGSDTLAGCTAEPLHITIYIEGPAGPPVTAESNVYTVNATGTTQTQLKNVTFFTCNAEDTTPSSAGHSDGYYYFTAPKGNSYCLRITGTQYNSSSQYINGYAGPYDKPYQVPSDFTKTDPTDKEDSYPSIQGTGTTPSCGPFWNPGDLAKTPCATGTYECQIAGVYDSTDKCSGSNDTSFDREADIGEDFEYHSMGEVCKAGVPPCHRGTNPYSPTCSINSPATVIPGHPWDLTYTISNASNSPLVFSNPPSTSPYYVNFTNKSTPVSVVGSLGLVGPASTDGGKTVTIRPSGETGDTWTSPTFSYDPTPGTYTVWMEVWANSPGNDIVTDCSSTVTVSFQPYLKVIGGDILAGVSSDYVASCYDGGANGGIYSFNNNSASNINTGAGTDLADLATGTISQFASGQGNILSMLDPLTFANTGAGPPPIYGGDVGSSTCSGSDYYSEISGLPATVAHSCGATVNTAATIPAKTLTPGNSYICYSKADVTISGNITYSGITSATPLNQMPVFMVVTKGGNIYVNTGVTKLAGAYVAERTGASGGDIDDTGNSNAVDEPAIGDNSQNTTNDDQLIIDGSFVANHLNLYRSYGAVTDTPSPTNYFDAEEFDYSPVNWLEPTPGSSSNPAIVSLTSLPPVF